MRTTIRPLRRALPALVAISALALAACGGGTDDDAGSAVSGDSSPDPATTTGESPAADPSEAASDDAAAGGGGAVTVGGANFTEMLVMQNIYAELLTDAGYDVTITSADNREIYAAALESGDIDVVPEYAATMAEFLNTGANGPDAAPIATADAAATVAAMQPLAEAAGLVVLEPAEAASQNAFGVSKAFADENSLTTLSDLAALGQPVRLAATEECPTRPFCQLGLEQTYGLTISELLPLGYGSPQAKQAVVDGNADLFLTGTTDAVLDGFGDGLVLLEDDKNLQLADNLVPVVNAEVATDQTLVDTLNQLSTVLTTDDLAELNRQVDAERQQPADVARAWLTDKGLIGG